MDDVGGPNPGWGYFTGFTLALVPPLWHALIKKKLDHWDNTFATDAEREIATKINKQVGYA